MAPAVRMHATGGPEVLLHEEVELSEPRAGEVRVRQHSAEVNFLDIYHRAGLHPLPSLLACPGVEAAADAHRTLEAGAPAGIPAPWTSAEGRQLT